MNTSPQSSVSRLSSVRPCSMVPSSWKAPAGGDGRCRGVGACRQVRGTVLTAQKRSVSLAGTGEGSAMQRTGKGAANELPNSHQPSPRSQAPHHCSPVSPVSSSIVNRHSSGGSSSLCGRSSRARAAHTPMPAGKCRRAGKGTGGGGEREARCADAAATSHGPTGSHYLGRCRCSAEHQGVCR